MEKTSHALELAVCDFVKLDIVSVDDTTKMPLGSPWLTFIYDDYTGLILGMHIGFTPPSYVSVVHALKNAVLPKSQIKEEYPSVQNEWLAYGIPQKMLIDNGKEFHSKQLQSICHSLNIELIYNLTRRTKIKSKIERLILTLNEQVKKQGIEHNKNSMVLQKMLEEILYRWLLDIYSVSYHRGLRGIPNILWEESIKIFPPTLAVWEINLDILFGVRTLRTIQPVGIKLNRLLYNSSELQMLRKESIKRRKQITVEVVQNPDDLSRIFVYNPFKQSYFDVPCLDQEYCKNLTLGVHNQILKLSRERSEESDRGSLIKTKAKIYEMIKEFHNTKTKKIRWRLKNDD